MDPVGRLASGPQCPPAGRGIELRQRRTGFHERYRDPIVGDGHPRHVSRVGQRGVNRLGIAVLPVERYIARDVVP